MEAQIRYMLFEDEYFTALNIKRMIGMYHPRLELIAEGDSVSKMRELLCANRDVDLVITDLQLADGLAFDTLREVGGDVPVIVFTAYDRFRTSLNGLNLIDFVLKPICEEDVEHAISRYEQFEKQIQKKYNN